MKNTAKKIMATTLAAIMLLGVFALAGCVQSDLAAYKEAAVTTIETYANVENYSAQNWEAVLDFVQDGKTAINAAEDKKTVDDAVKDTKGNIDEVQKEGEMGNPISIHFYRYWSFLPSEQDHKYYDFVGMTYSTKTILVENEDDWIDNKEEYKVVLTFTEENTEAFFKSIREKGIYDLEQNYHDNSISDGDSWCLIIAFSDGTVQKTTGYAKFPDQENSLDEVFLSLTGYKLFTPLWIDNHKNKKEVPKNV